MGKQITKNLKSEYYKLEEFTKSVTAAKLDINNEPPMEVVSNLQYGVEMILDPLRRCFGKPIVINSGYRCKELNKAVGGVPNSWHQKGNAADIKISSQPDAEKIFNILKNLPSVDTVLFEHSKAAQWLHVQWDRTKSPRQHFNFNYKA
jgi:zinc D-Ala-D-Ala carboxypeptidase